MQHGGEYLMELTHEWQGIIPAPDELLIRDQKKGFILFTAGFVFIISVILIILFPGRSGTIDNNISLFLLILCIGTGMAVIIRSLKMLIKPNVFIGMFIIIDKDDLVHWLKNGVLQRELEQLLRSENIDFIKMQRYQSNMFYDLPKGLHVLVSDPKDMGLISGKPVSLIMILIQNIIYENRDIAIKVQYTMDKLNIRDKYYASDKKKYAPLISIRGDD